MRHFLPDTNDVPTLSPRFDRRRGRDRRQTWRGGRRDSDWVNRPTDALRRFEARQRQSLLRKALSVLHLW